MSPSDRGTFMVRKYKQDRWYWPEIGNLADAEQASNAGCWAAVFCAAVTAIFAAISMFSGKSILGINAMAFGDAAVFAVIAWRIRARSKSFAVIGLVLFVLEKIYQFASQPQILGFGLFMAIILTLAFASGVRGTFAYHRMREAMALERAAAQEA